MTRTLVGNDKRKGQGRCFGKLGAWAVKGKDFATKKLHKQYIPERPSRVRTRELMHLEPGAGWFFSKERIAKVADGELSEPEKVP